MASLAGSLPMRVAAVYGLGAILVTAPVGTAEASAEVERLSNRAIAAVVASGGGGVVLDRDGHVLHVERDGSVRWTASLDPYSSPFGTAVGERVVLGGIRCDGVGCQHREAQVAVLDATGRVETTLGLDHSSGWPSPLNGLALAGGDEDSVWINAAGTLFHVTVAPARVVDRVPWPGGEPCIVDGVPYDLAATGGSSGRSGVDLTAAAALRFDLRLQRWDGRRWQPVAEGATSMPYGQNAYCTPDGYEIRDGAAPRARWSSGGGGWQPIDPPQAASAAAFAPVTTSTGHRYAVTADGSLLDVTHPEQPRPTGVVVPGFGTSDVPPAVQVDDSGGELFWCATVYQQGSPTTGCGSPEPGSRPATTRAAVMARPVLTSAHQYNLCSAACGGGVRAHSRDVVVWLAHRDRPVALSLNEHCYDDHVYLAAHLAAGLDGGASYTALGSATGCPGAVKQFGNQVWVVSTGTVRTAWAPFPSQATEPCDPSQNECRGFACAQPGDGHVFCSAHLESPRRAPGLGEIQVREYRDLVAQHYGDDVPRALAGDFNLARPNVDAVLVPSGFHAPTTGPTLGDDEQIDMVYVDDGTRGAGTTYCDLQASDHCHVTAALP